MWIFALAVFALVAIEIVREDMVVGYALVPSEVM
jgi:hypothetical protein